MKNTFLSICIILLFSCGNNQDDKIIKLDSQVKVLNQKLIEVYKPGFGILMSNIQQHHSKLWFAGIHKNWELAEFEIHEVRERFDDIKKYQKGKKETEMISIITPYLDSIENTIEQKDISKFKSNFKLLTNTCNTCHIATKHQFIEIKIPDLQSISNQKF